MREDRYFDKVSEQARGLGNLTSGEFFEPIQDMDQTKRQTGNPKASETG